MLSIMAAAALSIMDFGFPRLEDRLEDCLSRIGLQFEASGESARDVGEATVGACRSAMRLDPKRPVGESLRLNEAIVPKLREVVVTAVVRYRACGRRKDCWSIAFPG